MGEIFGWFADRYDCDHVAMRSAGRAWLKAACTVLGISIAIMLFFAQLITQPDGSILRAVLDGLPRWLPDAAFFGVCGGLLMAVYGWMVRHVGELLRKQI